VAKVGARGVHAQDHVDIQTNTWQAVNRERRDTILGYIRVELGHGPKTKFAHLSPLYIFPLKTKIIRAVD
jgi:hypothetical protein